MVPARLFSKVCAAAAALGALWLTGLGAGAADAQAARGWQLCNKTSYVIEASVGRRLRPGSCETALEGPLRPGIHYLFARSSNAHRGGRRIWGGDFPLCIDTTGSFSVESPKECTTMGLESRDFRPVLIENRNGWKTSLTETEEFDMEKAGAAGVQRLLADAGIYNGNIDGYIGRKTRAAIGEFLSQNSLDADTSDADLIDVLERHRTPRHRGLGEPRLVAAGKRRLCPRDR